MREQFKVQRITRNTLARWGPIRYEEVIRKVGCYVSGRRSSRGRITIRSPDVERRMTDHSAEQQLRHMRRTFVSRLRDRIRVPVLMLLVVFCYYRHLHGLRFWLKHIPHVWQHLTLLGINSKACKHPRTLRKHRFRSSAQQHPPLQHLTDRQ